MENGFKSMASWRDHSLILSNVTAGAKDRLIKITLEPSYTPQVINIDKE